MSGISILISVLPQTYSNLREQQAIIKPVLRLLKKYELVILGDPRSGCLRHREFHGVELSYWLKTQKLILHQLSRVSQLKIQDFKKRCDPARGQRASGSAPRHMLLVWLKPKENQEDIVIFG
ncbi:MAG: hypothetical protein QNJ65_01160 [Xenococcaceae cyanobacterium MO_234.B1]|nr:hypothetical protein [Xenococcaceae cyanobacterium MO_234.B1]